MNRPDREPLTPEERMLADRLARDGNAVSPSAALDAVILAAAREAAGAAQPQAQVATTQHRPSPRRRRWPFATGIAASLALAVGIAWQMRPVPDTEMRAASEVPSNAPASSTAPAPDVLRSREIATSSPAEPAPTPAPVEAAADAAVSDAASTADDTSPAASTRKESVAAESADTSSMSASMSAPAVEQIPAERPTAFVADPHPAVEPPPPAPAAMRAIPAPAPAPPPAPPSPPAPMQAPAETAARRAATPAAASATARQTQSESQAWMRDSIDDGPDDGDPPASANAPEVRAAWLARVRELLDAGRVADAKASLTEFHRRHPQADLPPDLRALLD